MKTKSIASRILVSSIAAAVLSSQVSAQSITKADNTTSLGTGSSWTGGIAPGTGNIADWSGTYNTTGSLSATLPGSAVTWDGISIGSLSGTASGLVSIGGTGTAVTGSSLTIGESGINMSGANQNVVINASTTNFNSSQTWNISTGRNLRFGTTGTGSANANVDGTNAAAVITVSGGGVVDANQGGVTGFADGAGFAHFAGKWQINSGATLRGIRNGATAWGTNTSADAITLNGGTLAVGGISGTQGDWTWNTPITVTPSTTASIDQQLFSGASRRLKLMGAITADATTNLIFKETGANNAFSSDDAGYIIAVDNPNLGGTVTIWGDGATENNSTGRLSSVRVGGVNGATDTSTGVGPAGTLGTASVVNNGVLTLSRNDTWTFANNISGTGLLRLGLNSSNGTTHVVTLSGNNTHSGGTTLNVGVTLKIASANALGSGTFTIGGGGTFDNATGATLGIANPFALSGGSPTFIGTDDMTINGAVTLSGITAGQTRTITVSAKSLTLSNTISESLASLGLTKAGPGTLTLSNSNSSFTGQVNLAGGTTNVSKLANLGSNSSLGAGNAAYTIRLNGGTLNYVGAGGDTTDRTIELQASGAINNNGSGPIAFTAPTLSHNGTASARTFTLGGNSTGGPNSFSSNITNSGTGTDLTSLVKNGGNTWILEGANTYSGNTTINAGVLALGASGSIANSPIITVASGGVFDLSASAFVLGSGQTLIAGRTSGFFTDVNGTLASTGTINPAANATKGTLSINGGLTLSGGTLHFDLTPGNTTAGSGVNDLIALTGALDLSGSTTINVTWTGAVQPGTYTLISGASLAAGNATNLLKGAGIINGGRSVFTLDTTTTAGSVLLSVTGAPMNLKWVGDGGANVWDIDATSNWNNGTTSDKFLDFDYVTFDDTSANGSVNLNSTVTPAAIIVNNSTTNYSIGGAGEITGATGLTKSGSASLTLDTFNTYSGGTTLNAGHLMCTLNNALGSGVFYLNGGIFSSDSTFALTVPNAIMVGGDATLGNTVNNGALTFSGTVNLGGVTRQLTTASDVTFSSAVSNGGLAKAGSGTLALGAASTYAGPTNVIDGTLRLTGSGAIASTSAITVDSGATLDYSVIGQTIANSITNNGSILRSTGTGNLYFSSTANTGTGSWSANSGYIGFNTVASLGSTNAINLNGGGIYFATAGQTVPATITITLGANGGTLNGSTSFTSTWNSKFTGTGGLTKISGEIAVLAAANDYTGTTTLNGGTLRISGATNTTSGPISFNGGTLQIASDGSFTTTGNSSTTSNAGSLNINAGGTLSVGAMTWSYAPGSFVVDGTLNITGALTPSWNNTRSLTGTGTINAGSFVNNNFSITTIAVNRLNLGGNISMNNAGSITLSGVTLGAYANWTGAAPMILAASTSTTINTLDSVDSTTARTITLDGALSGAGALVKTGAGTLILNANSSYSGTTSVNGGTLLVNNTSGSGTGSGAVDVTLGTLGGNGAIGGSVTVAADGNLEPGAGLGTLDINGNLDLAAMAAGAGKLKFELDALAGTNDLVAVTGTLTLGNLALDDLEITNLGGLQAGTYTLITSSALGGSVDATVATIASGFNGKLQISGNDLQLVVTAAGGTTYATWIDSYFTGETNPAIIGTGADPDKDGISNAVEMVIGGDPESAMDTALLPTLELVTNPTSTPAIPAGEYLLFSYRRSADSEAAGVTASCETDTDLAGPWTKTIDGISGAVIQEDLNFTFTPAAPPNTDRVRVYVPLGSNTELFGRLSVNVP